MSSSNYDVVIVGAGAAGLTAAIGLARAGFGVAVVEAAVFPGAENWSGCVYFCENLAHPDILGIDGVEALAWERRLVERGFFATDGHGLLGMTYRDPEAYRHCYTVLRPIFDHHLAQVAIRFGVTVFNSTTAESLIREDGHILGVCTNRGALYADLVFLAEGDASHLVTREGYERSSDPRHAPKFLQGIKQVIDLPPGVIEETFGVGPEEGIAYEMLLRNGTLKGRAVRLNMGGFVYSNRQSLSVGLVLPVDNLQEHFEGDPNLLLEWFEGLPALQPWLREGKRGVFGAKIIRGGGARDIPHLIDHGLAIGGAASAVGIDFPYPNFTGPATAMGLFVTQAACRIREEGGRFTREQLQRHYLEPLQQTHYWKDVEFLRRWPAYVKKTRVFFDRDLDLVLGSAHVWTRPNRWFLTRWTNWLHLVQQLGGPVHWPEIRTDLRELGRALRTREVAGRPALARLLLDGALNALRDLCRRPRANLRPAGTLRLHYTIAGATQPAAGLPALLRSWFGRFQPVLASAARQVYANDTRSLAEKLPAAVQILVRQLNLFDVLAWGGIGLAAALYSGFTAASRSLWRLARRRPALAPTGRPSPYTLAAQQAGDLTPLLAPSRQSWEGRLGGLAYETTRASHIHVLWPRSLADKDKVVTEGLWHVCPAHVYEARVSPLNQLQVVVNFENCIKCETCWRSSNLVDWARDGAHRFIYPVTSPVIGRLLAALDAAGQASTAQPRVIDYWEARAGGLADLLRRAAPQHWNGRSQDLRGEFGQLLDRMEHKLIEFDDALAEEPRTIDRGRSEYLEMLARYAHQLATRIVEVLQEAQTDVAPAWAVVQPHLLAVATSMVGRLEERWQRTWDQRFGWAAADGRQVRQHHLVGLRSLLHLLEERPTAPCESAAADSWLRAEADTAATQSRLAEWTQRLDILFPASSWRTIEQAPPSVEQDALLRELIAQVPILDPKDLANTLHPPLRKVLLAELGRRQPSLAYRVAVHLWARDLAGLTPSLAPFAERWQRADEWACFVALDTATEANGAFDGEALFVPAIRAGSLLLWVGGRLAVVRPDHNHMVPGLVLEPLPTLGLRGAGLMSVRLKDFALPDDAATPEGLQLVRAWQALSAADLTSIASGMADQLCRRASAHAATRVQFPGLFHDEDARDTIGKFGAVKKMIAEMAACHSLIETLDHNLSPEDFSPPSVERAGLVKAVVADCLGTALGSVSYNAGQVFGGTGYSEDDILARSYRDAAAWRFLPPANSDVYRAHGQALLDGWMPDGSALSQLDDRNEAQMRKELTQRKALQAENDEVSALQARLAGLVNEWLATAQGQAEAEMAELVGRQNAYLLASKALLSRTHARMESSRPAEVEIMLLRVWLERAGQTLHDLAGILQRIQTCARSQEGRPVIEPDAGPAVTSYQDYLAAPCPYDSGDFLVAPVDLVQPRLVPELLDADPALVSRREEIRAVLTGYFGTPRAGGLPYERYIESRHRPDPEDLEFCRQQGFFRMPIPRELGGEGRSKVEYYLLTANTQRLADVAISLTIQVNTSIGTTPIFLARDKDLPRALKEVGPFAADTALHTEVRQALVELATADMRRLGSTYQGLARRLDESVFSRAALKRHTQPFADSWRRAGRALQELDRANVQANLDEASKCWDQACAGAVALHDELRWRREACDLFLRWIASGQISAFALTEPSAGSDTARVATRARLRSSPVDVDGDGVLHFVPAGAQESRYLLDARRLEFSASGASYRWSPGAAPASIHHEDYDYETDDPRQMRFYDHGGRRVYFTDIAQLRQRDGRLWYDYWELTGAKMWITNGRMAGVMCLYAKTDEGVTGFMVDRHAEGLIVGKDEDKLGQCGSPTNELALQAVRVPRENLLGLEGRGQVNALETLNVGRAGLSISSMAQMAGLIESSREFAKASCPGSADIVPAWAAWRLERMEEECFIAEAVGWEVIGRFEHPRTKSVRMESAIAKLLNTELLHHVIETAEEVHGLAGQTRRHLVEKRKRDARVLTIYEGTNEIQRFLILKDLTSEVAPRWSRQVAVAPRHLGREALEVEALKAGLRQCVDAGLGVFGQGLWQNPNLQPAGFLLAEAAAWVKAADATLGRLAWLSRQAPSEEDVADAPRVRLAGRALLRCGQEVRQRLQRFDEELTHLRRGYYAPEIRAASLLFDSAQHTPAANLPASPVSRALSVLVVIEPWIGELPSPHVEQGRLLEPYWTWSEADRAALEAGLRLRAAAVAPVTVTVAAVGPERLAPLLREALSLGADVAILVGTVEETVTPDSAAAALVTLLEEAEFDLVLSGKGEADQQQGLVGRLTAAGLGVPFAGAASRLAVEVSGPRGEVVLARTDGGQTTTHVLPAAVAIEPGATLKPFTLDGYLRGASRLVQRHRWPSDVPARTVQFFASVGQRDGDGAEDLPRAVSADAVAHCIREEIGLNGAQHHADNGFDRPIVDVSQPRLSSGSAVAILLARSEGRLQATAAPAIRAARLLAGHEQVPLQILLITSTAEEDQRRGLAQLREVFRGDVLLLAGDMDGGNPEIAGRLLQETWHDMGLRPRLVVGEPCSEAAIAALAMCDETRRCLVLRARAITVDGGASVETSGARGKLRMRQSQPPGPETGWLTLAAECELAGEETGPQEGALRVDRWAPKLERFYGRADIQRLLHDLKREAGPLRLAEAEFIIDVGFGVGNRDGYEAVIEPLQAALHDLGVRSLMVGGSRKVTEELHLLPVDRQIGLSGVSVNPRILLAIGISGAPQHLNYIGPRALVVAFNRDPEAPLLTLNQRQARPRVFAVVGDLFQTVPAFIAALRQEQSARPDSSARP